MITRPRPPVAALWRRPAAKLCALAVAACALRWSALLGLWREEQRLLADTSPARVLVLTSHTGGGHMAAAAAIKEGFATLYPEGQFEVLVVDLLKEVTPRPWSWIPELYSWLMQHPTMWRLVYYGTQHGSGQIMTSLTFLLGRKSLSTFTAFRPDVVVSVHPMMQHSPLQMLRAGSSGPCTPEETQQQGGPSVVGAGATRGWFFDSDLGRGLDAFRLREGNGDGGACVPFVTVVTDLETCTNLWFHPSVTRVLAPSETVVDHALQLGLRQAQVLRVGSLLVRPSFAEVRDLPQQQLRQELGLDPDRRTVLFMGGGADVGLLHALVRALRTELFGEEAQLVVIAGRNEVFKRRLDEEIAEEEPVGLQTLVLGYTDEVPRWMRAADVLMTKAGPSSISEALSLGVPILLFGFLPGQERGNVDFVLRERVGRFVPRPREAARLVHEWLRPEGESVLEDMRRRALRLASGPEAAEVVVREVARLGSQHLYRQARRQRS